MLSGASNFVSGVDNTLLFIFYVSIFFLISITVTMLYFVYRYNKKRNPKSEHIEGNLTLEIIWTIIPLILVAIMFFYGWTNWKMMKSPPKDAFAIKSIARMWSWSFIYPNGKVTDTLYVPQNKPVIVHVSSADVIHSLYIPAFRLKQDMVPGNTKNFLWFIGQQQGTFDIFCAEYCGTRHSYMTTAVVVMPVTDFDKWYNDTSKIAAISKTGLKIFPGQAIMKKNGCFACHSIDGSRIVGPTFKAIYGEKTTVLINGNEQQITIDDNYIEESIYEPNAKILKGFQQGLMQPYKELITKDEIKQIVEYLKSLK
jgi:cytochrome c oxidase subunit 2